MKKGIRGLLAEVRRKKEQISQEIEFERFNFYEAAEISLTGASEFIKRYGELAEKMMKCALGEEKLCLGMIKNTCHNIAQNAPQNFLEAVQSLWFLFLIIHIESMASSFAPGRVDQYLYPFYRKDILDRRLKNEQALRIIEHLWLKFNEIVLLRGAQEAKYFAGFPIGFNVVLGGQDTKGNDATNELSYICLQASANLRLPQPNLSVRLHEKIPKEFPLEVGKVISLGFGMPQLFNDELIIPALVNRGVTLTNARNYAVIGCVELGIPGKSLGLSDAALFNLAKLLELTINRGNLRPIGQEYSAGTSKTSIELRERL